MSRSFDDETESFAVFIPMRAARDAARVLARIAKRLDREEDLVALLACEDDALEDVEWLTYHGPIQRQLVVGHRCLTLVLKPGKVTAFPPECDELDAVEVPFLAADGMQMVLYDRSGRSERWGGSIDRYPVGATVIAGRLQLDAADQAAAEAFHGRLVALLAG